MNTFKPLDPEIIKEPTQALFHKLGIKIIHISFLGRGECSGVFKIETPEKVYCLKTALFPERRQKVLNEATIRSQFIKQGLQFVPPPFYTDQKFFMYGAVIYDFVEGNISTFESREMIQQIAKSLAEIHNLNYKINTDGFKQTMGNFQALKKTMHHIEFDYPYLINASITEAFKRALHEYKIYIQAHRDLFSFGISGMLHGDLSNNFITDPNGKIWLIDWESSEYGDILEEICMFVFDNGIEGADRDFFFKEYKKHFPPVEPLDLEQIGLTYIRVMPAFNLCWGMDQLASNLAHRLEPERKLRDVDKSAENWKQFFSESTSNMIKEGVVQLTEKLVKEHDLEL